MYQKAEMFGDVGLRCACAGDNVSRAAGAMANALEDPEPHRFAEHFKKSRYVVQLGWCEGLGGDVVTHELMLIYLSLECDASSFSAGLFFAGLTNARGLTLSPVPHALEPAFLSC